MAETSKFINKVTADVKLASEWWKADTTKAVTKGFIQMTKASLILYFRLPVSWVLAQKVSGFCKQERTQIGWLPETQVAN